MTKVLLIGDLHVSDTPPVNCMDSYTDDIIEILMWLADYARNNDIDAVIWSGDIFDKKSPSKNSHALVLRMLEVVKEHEGKLWIVPGNHDVQYDRMDTLLTQQPLGVLFRAGAHLLDGWHESLPIYGVPWQRDWAHLDDTFLSWRLREHSDCLAVMHASIFPPELVEAVPYENLPAADVAKAMGNSGYLYYGHIHDYHGIFDVDNVMFANMGAISRGSLTESNKTRAVKACIWETGEGFTELDVPHKPADEVFKLEAAEVRAAQALDMEEFLRAVGSNTLDMVSVSATAEHIRALPDISDEVKALAVELLEEADGA
jgi:DNA repair exonuclease SbcCD nuclease subunit